ncbi:unnamed protein product [Moneuplotes crassus]|uniref:Uncharacterized protein n=1 Tax=Euplotes crassus TaxID=5936 RepID=A0AAD1U3G8_EUPCR|nr:unnamed protein product [Moneuplotes crassus]
MSTPTSVNCHDGVNDLSGFTSIPLTDSKAPVYDIDECIEKSGGFGKFQWLMIALATISLHGVNFFIYNLGFLELVPRLECLDSETGQFMECTKEDICREDSLIDRNLWKVDYSDEFSFNNWMTDMDLYCLSDFKIGLFGSFFFFGYALNGILLKQADKYGRKILIGGSFIMVVCAYCLFFWKNIYAKYAFLFLAGISMATKVALYIYCTEVCPKRYQIYVGSYVLSVSSFLVIIPTSVYLWIGYKNIQTALIVCLFLSVISAILTLYLPESPKFLYEKKRYKELRKTLSQICEINGTKLKSNFLIKGEQEHYEAYTKNSSKKLLKGYSSSTQEPLLEGTQSKIQIGNGPEYSVFQELQNPVTIINLIAVIICFSVVSFNFYMLSFYLKYVGGNIYLNTIGGAISDVIGNFTAGVIQRFFGTMKSFVICFFMALVFSIPLLFSQDPVIIAVSVFMSRLFLEGAYLIVYYVNPEIFPSLFVPFSFSVSGFISRFVTIGAPQLAEVRPRQLPVVIFIILCGVGIFASVSIKSSKK